jgi:phage terminase large subunit
MPLPFEFNFKNPDYKMVFEYRAERYRRLKENIAQLGAVKRYYRNNIAQFIIDWGMTEDPRNPERGLPAAIPFLLFDCQEEWVTWFVDCWKRGVPGATDKSRDLGVSWLACATVASMALLNMGIAALFVSRKEEYVDKSGDPKCLLYKVRRFISLLPPEFRSNWDEKRNSSHMRISIPHTCSSITGEAGDNPARGGRFSVVVLDESAWFSHPESVEASVTAATNCRQDISTPHGLNNPFARKIHNPNYEKRRLHWRQDPRKDEEWYKKKVEEINDPIIVNQELDLNYSASVDFIVIPAIHIQAAVDAHIILGIKPQGIRKIGLDVADEGRDLNAICGRHGILIESLEEWSGKGEDILHTVRKTFQLCDLLEYDMVDYDADGVGAGVRGDAKHLNESRERIIQFNAFHGAGSVVNPEDDPFKRESSNQDRIRTNENFFSNRKAQAWWSLRRRFAITYRAITAKNSGEDYEFSADEIISIPKGLKYLHKLVDELSQPTYGEDKVGRMLINKKPEGARSPNLADAVMIAFAPSEVKPIGFFDVWS